MQEQLMEKVRGNSNMKISKEKALNDSVSRMNTEIDEQLLIGRGRYHRSMSPSFQSYVENVDIGSPLLRFFRTRSPVSGNVASPGESFTSPTFGSGKYRSAMVQQYAGSNSSGSSSFGSRGRLSPLSSIENLDIPAMMPPPPVYGTPVKVDEEVIVMDDILVRSTPAGRSGRSSTGSSSEGGASLLSMPGKNALKWEICHAWEESGSCRYNSKCQFAHGKEELRPSRLIKMRRSEVQAIKSATSTAVSCTSDTKIPPLHQLQVEDVFEKAVIISQPVSPVKPKIGSNLANSITMRDWSPLDDGIRCILPHGSADKPPSKEEIDAYILRILYGSTTYRRLPAFAELCQETDLHE